MAVVIPLLGEMSAKQTKGCLNSGEFAAAVRLSLIYDNLRLKAIYKSAKVGSDSEPSRGRLQPNRRAERDFCGKGGVA